ncbi:glucose-1-phosphate adenylyltransferase subunit GlgD [Clostridium malenominatum]|uniref:Glucose-1-phosphate adenylyltransferase subunit GlgD n=1 Tax=Clostridium malenominatum TaxID=1539 RepID=A0ABN1IPK5_9CLOT
MIKDYMGILNLNENEDNIKPLTVVRPLASIPIGGRYRIVDFILSNMVNAGIENVGIFTKTKSRSLLDHLGSGKPWDLDRKINGLFIFNFGQMSSYSEDVDLLKTNMEYFNRSKQKYVILASSDMICNINFKEVARSHQSSGKDVTMVYKNIDDGISNFIGYDSLNMDKEGNLSSIGKNIGREDNISIFTGILVMKKDFLVEILEKALQTGSAKNVKGYVKKNFKKMSINLYKFEGYLQCINSITTYYKANMDILHEEVRKELFYKNGLIYTKVKDEAPTKYGEASKVKNSLVANGCIIEGEVKDSIIGRRVKIGKSVRIENCIIMQGSEVREGAILKNVIIDKNNIIDISKELIGDRENPLVIEKRVLK